jgi:hypothetical protein
MPRALLPPLPLPLQLPLRAPLRLPLPMRPLQQPHLQQPMQRQRDPRGRRRRIPEARQKLVLRVMSQTIPRLKLLIS